MLLLTFSWREVSNKTKLRKTENISVCYVVNEIVTTMCDEPGVFQKDVGYFQSELGISWKFLGGYWGYWIDVSCHRWKRLNEDQFKES